MLASILFSKAPLVLRKAATNMWLQANRTSHNPGFAIHGEKTSCVMIGFQERGLERLSPDDAFDCVRSLGVNAQKVDLSSNVPLLETIVKSNPSIVEPLPDLLEEACQYVDDLNSQISLPIRGAGRNIIESLYVSDSKSIFRLKPPLTFTRFDSQQAKSVAIAPSGFEPWGLVKGEIHCVHQPLAPSHRGALVVTFKKM